MVAYGRIVPDWMLALPRYGCLNLHGSLLPKYRGAAPIQWAVANGETHTGVTTMRLDAGLDTGPMLLAQVEPIAPEETAEDLFESLAEVGARLMVKTLHGLEAGDSDASRTAPWEGHARSYPDPGGWTHGLWADGGGAGESLAGISAVAGCVDDAAR